MIVSSFLIKNFVTCSSNVRQPHPVVNNSKGMNLLNRNQQIKWQSMLSGVLTMIRDILLERLLKKMHLSDLILILLIELNWYQQNIICWSGHLSAIHSDSSLQFHSALTILFWYHRSLKNSILLNHFHGENILAKTVCFVIELWHECHPLKSSYLFYLYLKWSEDEYFWMTHPLIHWIHVCESVIIIHHNKKYIEHFSYFITSLFPRSKSNINSFGAQNLDPLSINHSNPLFRSTAVWMVWTIPLQSQWLFACESWFGNIRDWIGRRFSGQVDSMMETSVICKMIIFDWSSNFNTKWSATNTNDLKNFVVDFELLKMIVRSRLKRERLNNQSSS